MSEAIGRLKRERRSRAIGALAWHVYIYMPNLPNEPECKARVQRMMDAERRSGEIVSSWNDICEVLQENRLGRYQTLPPDDIWISKKNRTR